MKKALIFIFLFAFLSLSACGTGGGKANAKIPPEAHRMAAAKPTQNYRPKRTAERRLDD